jgi:hypothetical protein
MTPMHHPPPATRAVGWLTGAAGQSTQCGSCGAGRLRTEAKTGDQPARRTVLAQEALRALGRESFADHIGGAGQAQ